ncbi:MAG: hypothetical protein OXB88_06765 [Bacteriovoracales bacterium]|nr:hypothetical protein [Bacteriovoracales bacterium]
MKFFILAFLLSGALSAAYIDCNSESGNTRIRLDIDEAMGNLRDIRFTRKIAGERWEMVGKRLALSSRNLYLCNPRREWKRYTLCIQEFDLAGGFISVIFRDPASIGWYDDRGEDDIVFNLTSVGGGARGHFRAVLFRSIYPSPEGLRVEHRRIPVLCKKRT